MVTHNPSLSTVQKLFEYYAAKNIPAFLSLFTEDAEWIEPGTPNAISYAGSFKGVAGITKLLTTLAQSLNMKHFVPTQFVSEGNTVVVCGDSSADVLSTGKSYTTRWLYLFTITGDKISRLEVFMDTLAIANAFKP